MNKNTPDKIFNKNRQMQNLARAKTLAPEGSDFLLDYAIEDFQTRLQFVQRDFDKVLALFGRNTKLSQMLQACPNIKQVMRVEEELYADAEPPFAPSHIKQTQDDVPLGLGDSSVDLIVSAFALHWSNDVIGDLIQIRRGLVPDGLFLGLLPGAGTLHELREVMLIADSECFGGAISRIDPFADVQDIGAAMQRAKFALPVVDVDEVIVRYDTPMELINDLRNMGANSALNRELPQNHYAGKAYLKRLCEIYQEKFSDPDGRIRATFSFISMSGWSPSENQPKPLKPGSATTRLADALNTKEEKL